MPLQLDMKAINQYVSLGVKVVAAPMIGVWILSLGFIVYNIGYDTFFKPSMEKLKSLDESMTSQRNLANQKKSELEQFRVWKEKLKGLSTSIRSVGEGQQAKVLAVSESSSVLDYVKGLRRDPDLGPVLPDPHNKLEFLTLTPTGDTIVNILAPPAPDGQSGAQPPAPPPSSGPAPGESANGHGAPPPTTEVSRINLWRFDYDLKVKGTYPALVDLINNIVDSENLLALNKISIVTKPEDARPSGVIKPATATSSSTLPGPLSNLPGMSGEPATASPADPNGAAIPDVPIPVEMTLSFSIYLYDPNIQNIDPAAPQN